MSMGRRAFFKQTAVAAGLLGAARLAPAVTAPTSSPGNGLMALLIDSDRDRLLERLADRIRSGLDYPTLLGALSEASVRQIRPYSHVGFKYHAFMVLHAVHQTAQHGRPEDRWLPVLWAADVFKGSQATERRLGNWTLGPVPEHLIPSARKAESTFRDAMARWDLEKADVAVVGLARSLPRDQLFELLFRYGARDFRAIGHKAISVANCHRLLGVVSAEHSEPMLRSLVLALLNHEGEPNPAGDDLFADRPWRRNLRLAQAARPTEKQKDEHDDAALAEILKVLREGSDEDASRGVHERLDQQATDQEIWTAIFLAAGDLMLRQSGIISVHANTTVSALHYAYRHISDPSTRRLIMLQAAAFLPLFRELLSGNRRSLRIDSLEAAAVGQGDGDPRDALEDIFETLSIDRVEAARKTLGYLGKGRAKAPFRDLARHYVVDRNTGYHDYKFTEAAFENAAMMESPWRECYLAASVLYLNGSGDEPNETVARARASLA